MAHLVPPFELSRKIGEVVDIDAATVGALLDTCIARYGAPFKAAIAGATIVVNGRSINLLEGRRTPLGPADSVWLLRPSAGG